MLYAIGEGLFTIELDQPFHFPSTFTFFFKELSTPKGIGYTLNLNLSFAKFVSP